MICGLALVGSTVVIVGVIGGLHAWLVGKTDPQRLEYVRRIYLAGMARFR